MAAGTWKIYGQAKKSFGNGTITLGAGVFKMALHRTSASAAILVLSTRIQWAMSEAWLSTAASSSPRAG